MQQRALGSSGFEISTIGIGTWATGGWMWGGQDDDASVQAIHAAVDHGVNWIDTAPIYGSGHSEA
ncbi:MAG TPA: aldo/keto reductase, partial [Luteolibacter sp.]|nr:aldo/keto reductase [Luteolibacter sp.]